MTQRVRRTLASAALFCLCASAAEAQQTDNPFKSLAKLLGFATDIAPPADFVAKSRPATEGDYIPVFRPPPEPAKAALNKDQLNALKGDLDSVEKSADKVRAGFPPSAKAMAEADAARKKAAANSAPPKQ